MVDLQESTIVMGRSLTPSPRTVNLDQAASRFAQLQTITPFHRRYVVFPSRLRKRAPPDSQGLAVTPTTAGISDHVCGLPGLVN